MTKNDTVRWEPTLMYINVHTMCTETWKRPKWPKND